MEAGKPGSAGRPHRSAAFVAVAAALSVGIAVVSVALPRGESGQPRPARSTYSTPPTSPEASPRVAVVSDSLFSGLQNRGPTHPRSGSALTRSLVDAGWDPVMVSTHPGWATVSLRPFIDEAVATHPDLLLLSTGSNDVAQALTASPPTVDLDHAIAQLEAVFEVTARIPCVVLPDVRAALTMYWPDSADLDIVQSVNAAIHRSGRRYDNIRVVPWSRQSALRPEWFIPDGLHPSGPGAGQSGPGEAVFQRTMFEAGASCLADHAARD